MCFSFNPEKVEKEATFLGEKDKLVYIVHPLTGLKIRWSFATIYSRVREPLAQP